MDKTWPRTPVKSVETRKRDLVIRISDWTRQSFRTGEPAYDVEVYDRGVYNWNESRTFPLRTMSKPDARRTAIEFAQRQIARLLK